MKSLFGTKASFEALTRAFVTFAILNKSISDVNVEAVLYLFIYFHFLG